MHVITSKDNEKIKQIKKLKEKKYRDTENCFIVEGIKIVKEAILENQNIKCIVICEDCINDGTIEAKLLLKIAKFNCIYVSKNVFDSISEVNSPQGIMAIVEKNNKDSKIDYNEDIIVEASCLSDLSIFINNGSASSFSFGIGRDFDVPGGAHLADEFYPSNADGAGAFRDFYFL